MLCQSEAGIWLVLKPATVSEYSAASSVVERESLFCFMHFQEDWKGIQRKAVQYSNIN